MGTDIDSIYEEWRLEFEKLEEELAQFRDYFCSVKKCKCDIRECKHYKKVRHEIFGSKIDRLFNMRLQASIQVYRENVTSTRS